MDYESFVKEYDRLIELLLSYSPDQAGSLVYSEKLGELEDKYPEFAKRHDEELP